MSTDTIEVWEIAPSLDPDYDSMVVTDYHEAVRCITKVVEDIMEDVDRGSAPATLTISNFMMEKEEYQRITEQSAEVEYATFTQTKENTP